jgi:hypothetical protein
MEYSLSSSLVGGSGSLNPDGLSLDLQFAADKTLTARKGPTPVFTRANTTATFVGSNGTIQNATNNVARFDHNVSYVESSVYVTSSNAVSENGLQLPSQRVYFSGIDGNGYPEFISDIYHISFSSGQWILDGDSGGFQAHANTILSDEYVTDVGTGFVTVVLTLACKGLLIEEQRTNQIKYSYNNFTNAYWNSTANNITAVDSFTDGPDGIASGASSITEVAGVLLTRHIHETTGAFTPAANTAYTMSAWVKQPPSNPVRYVQLAFWIAGFGSTAYMNYDIQSGTVGTGGAGITASSITAYPNRWYRITATATSVASPAASGFQLGFSTSSSAVRTEAYTVVSPLKSIYLWGAQVEQGAFATSYIPTVSSSLTRSVDVCSISGVSTFYNSTEATLFVEALVGGTATFPSIISLDNSTSNNQLALSAFPSPNTVQGFVVSGGTTSASPNRPLTLGTFFKAASSNKLNSFQISMNGVNGTLDTSGAMPVGISTMNIGRSWNGNAINGYLKSVRVYKKAVTDAKLITLTT